MDEMKLLIKRHKILSRLNVACLYCVIAVTLIFMIVGVDSDEYITLSLCSSILFITEYILSLFAYLKKKTVLIAIRFVEVVVFTFLATALEFDMAGTIIVFLMMVATVVEYMMIFRFESKMDIVYAGVTCFVPLLLGVIIRIDTDMQWYFYLELLVAMIVFVLVFAYLVYSYYNLISRNDRKIMAKERIIESLKEDYDKISVVQNKLITVNDQLNGKRIELERAYNNLDRTNKEIQMQYTLIQEFSKTLELESIVDSALRKVLDTFKLSFSAAVLYDNDDNINFKCMHYDEENIQPAIVERLERMCKDTNMCQMFKELEYTTYDNSVTMEKYHAIHEFGIGSVLVAPISLDDGYGVFIVGTTQYNYFRDNIFFFSTMVKQLEMFIINALLYERIEIQSRTDGLSGLYNRWHLSNVYADYVNRINEYDSLAIAILDIDNFKRINDSYGHPFGDSVIKACANKVKEIAKENNIFAARYGGEEFGLILPNKSYPEVLSILHKLQDAINDEAVYNDEIKKYISYNVSIGAAIYPNTCDSINMLLTRADKALYYSKEHGKNKITMDNINLYKEEQ
ncbi:MAG: diguanylate cyclase [Lachnospiraceae bacterium]|nr:diguanylate cyclase [Lachnospiraceae bacterium]